MILSADGLCVDASLPGPMVVAISRRNGLPHLHTQHLVDIDGVLLNLDFLLQGQLPAVQCLQLCLSLGQGFL